MAGTVVLDATSWETFLKALSGKMDKSDQYLRAAAGTVGFKDIIEHFAEEKGPNGAWPIRSPSTKERYARILSGMSKPPAGTARGAFDPSNKLLQLTGLLRQSLMPGKGGIRSGGKNAVVMFTNVVYARTHDEGRGPIPQREFMYLSEGGQQRMVDVLLGMITEGL